MKISDVTAFAINAGHRNICLVKVDTDAGIAGWGEAGLSSREQAVAGMVRHFKEFLVGKDATRIGAIWQELYRGQYFEGGRTITAAISAIDIALWDIAGKALGVPVHRLLGGMQRDRIPCFITSTAPMDDRLIADGIALRDLGWDCIRATIAGRGDESIFDPRKALAQAATALTELRTALGSSIVLGIDFHHRLQVAEAASFCQRMPPGTLDFLEEPIRQQTPGAYQALKHMTQIPLAIGEEFASRWDFAPYIEQDITSFARIDVCNVGGLSEAMRIASLAETHYIDVMPHDPLSPLCTAATIQLCAAIPNLAWCEVDPYGLDTSAYDRLFPVRPRLEGTHFLVNQSPGLGIEVDESAVRSASFSYWEPPRRYKPDGSYTNW